MKKELLLTNVVLVTATITGILGEMVGYDIRAVLTILLLVSAGALGVLHGSRGDEKQSLMFGCAAGLLLVLALPGWGNASELIATIPWVGVILSGIFHSLVLAFVVIAALSLISRFLVFSPRDRVSSN